MEVLKRKLFSSLTPVTRAAWGAAIATDCPQLLQLLTHLFSALERTERAGRQAACVWVPAQPQQRSRQPPSRSQKLGQSRVEGRRQHTDPKNATPHTCTAVWMPMQQCTASPMACVQLGLRLPTERKQHLIDLLPQQ